MGDDAGFKHVYGEAADKSQFDFRGVKLHFDDGNQGNEDISACLVAETLFDSKDCAFDIQTFEVLRIQQKDDEQRIITEGRDQAIPFLFAITKAPSNVVIDQILGQPKSLEGIYQGFGRIGAKYRDIWRQKASLGQTYVEGNCYRSTKQTEKGIGSRHRALEEVGNAT